MTRLALSVLIGSFLACGVAEAQTAVPGAPAVTLPPLVSLPPCPAVDTTQEASDQALLKAAIEVAHQGGIKALQPQIDGLKQALARAPRGIAPVEQCDGRLVVTSSFTDFLIYSMMMSSHKNEHQDFQGVDFKPSPYPTIAFILGSYYNEMLDYSTALTYLKMGLSMEPTSPSLVTETATSLSQLKRFDESAALTDEMLKHAALLDNPSHARILRARGTALEGLGRLDEAQAAYTQSLQFAPDNPVALNELRYIAALRAGRPPTDTRLTTSAKPPPN